MENNFVGCLTRSVDRGCIIYFYTIESEYVNELGDFFSEINHMFTDESMIIFAVEEKDESHEESVVACRVINRITSESKDLHRIQYQEVCEFFDELTAIINRHE